MNKRIFVLAFVSAAFFFGCSADYSFNSNIAPPAWSGTPSTNDSTGVPITPTDPEPVLEEYCDLPAYAYCVILDEQMTLELCDESGGSIVNECPDYSK